MSIASQQRCLGCGAGLAPLARHGNPRKWCSESCRQRTRRTRGCREVPPCDVCGRPSLTGLRCATCARYGDPLARRRIFDRDGWICGICHTPVDPAAVWPSIRAATIDHIVARTRGGADEDSNVQCAHFGCNIRKGNRLTAASVADSSWGAPGCLIGALVGTA